jgi:tRNA(Ile)-lysidine synthase
MAEVRLGRGVAAEPIDQPLRIESGAGSGRAIVGGRVVDVEWATAPNGSNGQPGRSALGVVVDASRAPLELRSWRPGDRMRLPAGSRKLKKLFNDWRVERPERSRTPVLADASGRILWIAGRAAAVDAATVGEPHLRISVRDAELE